MGLVWVWLVRWIPETVGVLVLKKVFRLQSVAGEWEQVYEMFRSKQGLGEQAILVRDGFDWADRKPLVQVLMEIPRI